MEWWRRGVIYMLYIRIKLLIRCLMTVLYILKSGVRPTCLLLCSRLHTRGFAAQIAPGVKSSSYNWVINMHEYTHCTYSFKIYTLCRCLRQGFVWTTTFTRFVGHFAVGVYVLLDCRAGHQTFQICCGFSCAVTTKQTVTNVRSYCGYG